MFHVPPTQHQSVTNTGLGLDSLKLILNLFFRNPGKKKQKKSCETKAPRLSFLCPKISAVTTRSIHLASPTTGEDTGSGVKGGPSSVTN